MAGACKEIRAGSASGSRIPLDDAVGDQLERARWRSGSSGSSRLEATTSSSASPRASSSASVRAIRAHTSDACVGGPDPAQIELHELRVTLTGEDQRQRHRAVQQVGAARLAGQLARTRDVQHVVEHLEREPDPLAERSRARRPGRRPRSRRARRRPRTGRRSSARSDRSSARARRPAPRVRALHQLAARRAPAGAATAPAAVADADRCARARRTRVRTAGRRSRSPRRRPAAAKTVRPPAPQRRRRRARRRGRASPRGSARPRPRPRELARVPRRRDAGGEEHEQRAQPLAAGGDRRHACSSPSSRAVRPVGQLAHAELEPAPSAARRARPPAARTARRHCRAHMRTSPTCIAMMPPAVSGTRSSRSPDSAITAASASGPGKRRTELGR